MSCSSWGNSTVFSSSPSFSFCIMLFFFVGGLCEVQLKVVGVFLASRETCKVRMQEFRRLIIIFASFPAIG